MGNYKLTDPEFAERFEHFAFDEVINEEGQQLDGITRHMAVAATLIGCQGIDAFRLEVPRALDAGLTPVMLKEKSSAGRPGHDYDGKPPGERRAGAGRHLRRPHERSLESRTHQPLAGSELLRRLLHTHRARLKTA